MTRDHRRLAAIVSVDVAGYSRLMGVDESGTLAALKAHRRELIDPKIAEYGGRIVKATGDGLLLEFPSVVDAVRCAVDVQRGMAERNAGLPPDQRLDFRIGINVGDIIIDDDDIHGDGVNVAARLQALAEPGGICTSRVVRDQVLDKLSFTFEDLGAQQVKNIARPVEVYRVDLGSVDTRTPTGGHRHWRRVTRALGRPWLAAGVLALGVAGIAAWTLFQHSKSTPNTAPPAMSVAVLPFTATQGDADTVRFAEAITRDLATTFGRSDRMARVTLGSSATANVNAGVDPRLLGRELGVRYLIRGDVHRAAETNTVNLRLVNIETGEQILSDRITLQDADVTGGQSTQLRAVCEHLSAVLRNAEMRRAVAEPASEASAMDFVLRARAARAQGGNSLSTAIEQRKLFDEALRRDPNLVPALWGRVNALDTELDLDPTGNRDCIVQEMDDLTSRAVKLDPDDPDAWDARAMALMYSGRWDAALEANARALALDPNASWLLKSRAWLMNMSGKPGEALVLVDRAFAMDPRDAGLQMRMACEAHLLFGQDERAIATCEKAAGLLDDWIVHLFLIAAYANHGDMAKADAEKAEVLRRAPGYTIATLKSKRYSVNPEYMKLAEAHWYAGLRKAGIPEN